MKIVFKGKLHFVLMPQRITTLVIAIVLLLSRTWLGLHDSATRVAAWAEVTGKPTIFPPSTHSYLWNQVTGIPATATRWPNVGEQGYTQPLAGNEWIKLPNGLILQWRTKDYASYPSEVADSVTFPIASPNACLFFCTTRKVSGHNQDGDNGTQIVSISKTSVSLSLFLVVQQAV